MNDIKSIIKVKKIHISNEYGILSAMKETLLMAVLGVAKMIDLPSNMPSVTGSSDYLVLGDLL